MNPLFAVRWASDQVEDEWIRPAVSCRWNDPEGEMALDDTAMREALLERLIGEMTQLAASSRTAEQHLRLIDLSLARLASQMERLEGRQDVVVEQRRG